MLLTLLIFLLASNAVTLRREKSIYYSRIAIIGLITTSYITYNNLFTTPLQNGIGIYGGLFNVTTFTHVFNIFILLVAAVILVLTAFYPRKVYIKEWSSFYNILFNKIRYNKNTISNKTGKQFSIIEYPLIIIFILSGGIFLISSSDLISIFLSIELQSYGLYILSALYRDSELSTGSALTYFLLGGLSSCFILLGSALLYVLSGTTNLENIYYMINYFANFVHPNIIVDSNIQELSSPVQYWDKIYYLQLSIVIMVVGLLFKVSAAPFHFWSPDVYDGIPTVVTTFVAIIAKISIFAFLLEFVYNTESSLMNFSWKNILLVSSLLSLVIGSVLGLTQFRVKRLLAYSTISHLGFILLALSIDTPESIQSYIFYILQYSLSNLNVFIILLTVGYTLFLYTYRNRDQTNDKEREELVDQNNSPIQLISQIKGYFYVNPFIAISLTITLFSFVGVPPVIGFFAKQMVLSAALDNGYVFMSLVAILTSVIGAGYYLNLVKNIFFFKNEYQTHVVGKDINPNLRGYITSYSNDNVELSDNSNKIAKSFTPLDIKVSSSLGVVISIITLILILFIFVPDEWFNLVNILTLNLFKI